mmetsp:Transcript_63102/g.131169  ORF Transcript_63102/g.131169 Transcript_63102/m.131169 type:complete len:83 (+) Transcript_63102:538-786(+)
MRRQCSADFLPDLKRKTRRFASHLAGWEAVMKSLSMDDQTDIDLLKCSNQICILVESHTTQVSCCLALDRKMVRESKLLMIL